MRRKENIRRIGKHHEEKRKDKENRENIMRRKEKIRRIGKTL